MPPEQHQRPGSLDWQLDAFARRDQLLPETNKPPSVVSEIVAEVVDRAKQVVAKVRKVTKTQAAVEWLATVLQQGPVAQKDIEAMAKMAKIGTKPLKLAKEKLK